MSPPLFVQNKEEISREHKLVVDSMTYDKAGTYVCVISVPEMEGMDTNGTLRVQVQGKDLERPQYDDPSQSLNYQKRLSVLYFVAFYKVSLDVKCNVHTSYYWGSSTAVIKYPKTLLLIVYLPPQSLPHAKNATWLDPQNHSRYEDSDWSFIFLSSFSSFSRPACLSAGSPEITPPKVTEIEEFLDRIVDLTCDVRGFPAPIVTWTSPDGKVTAHRDCFNSE